MKNRGRNKLFMCLRPVTIDDGPVKIKRSSVSGDPVLTYIAVGGEGKERTVIPKILAHLPDEDSARVASGAGIGRKASSSWRFSRALKAVLFDISLQMKMNGGKKYHQNSFRSNSNLPTKSKKKSDSMNEKASSRELLETEDMYRINLSRSSSIFSSSTNASSSLSSSCASSITSNSRSVSQRNGSFRAKSMELKQVQQKQASAKEVGIGYFSSNTGLCLLLLSLLVLILLGKVCAILYTSTWLFFLPRRFNGVDSATINMVDSPDVVSEEYKKRVIMEGLLERNRSRLL